MLRIRSRLGIGLVLALLALGLVSAAGATSSNGEPFPPEACSELLLNGDFESAADDWIQEGAGVIPLITAFNPRTGQYGADLGGETNSDHRIKQQITLPADRHTVLRFWWEQTTQETTPGDADYLAVRLLQPGGTLLEELVRLGADPAEPPWQRVTVELDAYAGQSVQLQFLAHNNGSAPTEFFVDDVSVSACLGFRTYLPFVQK